MFSPWTDEARPFALVWWGGLLFACTLYALGRRAGLAPRIDAVGSIHYKLRLRSRGAKRTLALYVTTRRHTEASEETTDGRPPP